MNKIKLKNLVTASARGLFEKPPNEGDKEQAEIITTKDLIDGHIDTRNLERKELPAIKAFSRSMTREKDVLFTVKGPSFKSAIVDADSKDRIFSSNIISLRVNERILLPEILVAYLNSPEGRHELDSISRGVATQSISVNNLLELIIPVPPLETQFVLKECLNSVDRYLEALHQEEEQVKKIKEHIISSLLGGVE